jgi:hypothetical protein
VQGDIFLTAHGDRDSALCVGRVRLGKTLFGDD